VEEIVEETMLAGMADKAKLAVSQLVKFMRENGVWGVEGSWLIELALEERVDDFRKADPVTVIEYACFVAVAADHLLEYPNPDFLKRLQEMVKGDTNALSQRMVFTHLFGPERKLIIDAMEHCKNMAGVN